MNLYIWEGDGVLTDYSDGMIVAIAPSLEEAHKIINDQTSYIEAGKNYPHQPSEVIPIGDQVPCKSWYVWGGS